MKSTKARPGGRRKKGGRVDESLGCQSSLSRVRRSTKRVAINIKRIKEKGDAACFPQQGRIRNHSGIGGEGISRTRTRPLKRNELEFKKKGPQPKRAGLDLGGKRLFWPIHGMFFCCGRGGVTEGGVTYEKKLTWDSGRRGRREEEGMVFFCRKSEVTPKKKKENCAMGTKSKEKNRLSRIP